MGLGKQEGGCGTGCMIGCFLAVLVSDMFDSWCPAFPVHQVFLVFVLLCPVDKMAIKNYIACKSEQLPECSELLPWEQ